MENPKLDVNLEVNLDGVEEVEVEVDLNLDSNVEQVRDMDLKADQRKESGLGSGLKNTGFVRDPEDPALEKSSLEIQPTTNELEDKGFERDTWNSKTEFLLSCIAMSVGLGNVWRFPFVAYNNGGGAFLIPYILVVFLIGKPVYFLELSMGQFSSYGQVKVWKMSPIMRGIGFGSMFATIFSLSYYCYQMALTIFYLIQSFRSKLPWDDCLAEWLPEGSNQTCLDWLKSQNMTISEYYYQEVVLNEAAHIEDGLGTPDWRLASCLLASWIIVFLIIMRGVKSSGKVAYFNAIFPYIVLIILLIRGVTLDGAWEGIKYFIKPQWDKMLEAEVWFAAVGQCFFSLTAGFGPIIMYASYNDFKHNLYRDAMIISFMDLFTSLLAGFTIFAVVGNLAHTSGAAVEDAVKDGSGLAFISYPQAIAQFGWAPQFFSVLFFLMMFTLGVGSSTSDTQSIVTILCDQFPSLQRQRWKITGVVCVLGFFAGLIYTTPGGPFILTLVDSYGANFTVFLMAMFEVMGVAWVYGLNNFCKDLEFMLDIKVSWYWKFCWGLFVPIVLLAILIYSLITETSIDYKDLPYPKVATGMGWFLTAITFSTIPILAVYAISKSEGSNIIQRIKNAASPSASWGPRNPKYRREWIEYKQKNA